MRFLFILLFCLPVIIVAQTVELTYDQANNIDLVQNYKDNTVINSYKTKDGFIINVGDTLTIGNAIIKKKKRKKYLFSDVFSYIAAGKIKNTVNKEYKYLPHSYSGTQVIIKSIFVTHKKYSGYKVWPNSKSMPLYISVFVQAPKEGFSRVLGTSRQTIIDIDQAISSGEIIHNDALADISDQNVKSSDDKYELLFKLSKLKESGILTEEEFQNEKRRILNQY